MNLTKEGPQNIGQIRKQLEHGNLYLSPEEYQRENSWKPKQKQLLIDTIFRGMDIPKFYLWKINFSTLSNGYPDGEAKSLYKGILDRKRNENDDEDPYIFEVVDGQQRIRTILEFMGSKPPNDNCYRGIWSDVFASSSDTPMAKGRLYSQLNAEQQSMFEEKPLSVMILENANIDEIRDMFLRLQNGTPLNAQQKRDAMGANIGRVAKEIASLPFFTKSVGFENRSSTYHLIASQILQLELKDKIVSCTSPQLDKLYEHYKKTQLDESTVKRSKRIVDILGKVFPEKNQHLNQNYALSLYWLLSRILMNYVISADQYPKIRSNFELMDIDRVKARERDYSGKDDEKFSDLSLAMSRGNTGVDGITTRHDIIGRFLFDKVNLQEKPNLDPCRGFSHEEKLILYHQAQGLCQLEHNGKICARAISFDDAVVDHIIPHSLEGKTELSNGRIAFKSCNIARGNRDTFDPSTDCKLLRGKIVDAD